MAHIYPTYRTVEIRHPEYPEDAEPLVAVIQRNLTNRQIDELPNLTADSKSTMKDLRDAIAPYVKSWNWEAETEDGTLASVPAPADGGGDVFKLIDDHFAFQLYFHIKHAHLGGPPNTAEGDERKNSSAASDTTPNGSHAATHAIATPTKPTLITDSPKKPRKSGSPKANTTLSTNA